MLDIFVLFTIAKQQRLFTRDLLKGLNGRFSDRPWMELRKGKEVSEIWLSQQVRPYGIRPRTIWIGQSCAKGYLFEDFREAFRRYIPQAELNTLLTESKEPEPEASPNHSPDGSPDAT